MKRIVVGTFEWLHRWRFAVLLACVCASAIAISLKQRDYVLPWFGETVTISEITPESGRAYVAKLSRSDLGVGNTSVDAVLYEISAHRREQVFEPLESTWVGHLNAFYSLTALILVRYPNLSTEHAEMIGPGDQDLWTIEDSGGGSYRIQDGLLHFSTSDDTSPTANGRRYELLLPELPPRVVRMFALGTRVGSLAIVGATILVVLGKGRRTRRLLANTLPGIANTLILLALLVGGFEVYQRLHGRFIDINLPSHVDPVAGTIFDANADIRFTNHLEYWVAQRSNSLGFLDNEPLIPKPRGCFRVLLVGDSFVEASRVAIADKLQSILGTELQGRLGQGKADVVAFGYSGTGQANQLGFYEKYGKAVAPDLVILLLIDNDFADNSPILAAIRNGWQPYRPPRLFFEMDGESFRRVSIDPEWKRHFLHGGSAKDHYLELKEDPVIAPQLAGWDGPNDMTHHAGADEIDEMFWHRDLPPVFQDAVVLTRHAIDTWKSIGQQDGFGVVLVAAENLTRSGSDDVRDGALQLSRFRDIAAAEQLPFLDLRPYFAAHGDPDSAHWRHDSHWNEQGHRWAAQAVFEFLVTNRLVPSSDEDAVRR